MAIQRWLAPRVVVSRWPGSLNLVAGLDAAYSPDGRRCLAAAVLWDVDEGRVVERSLASRRLRFPYVPGLLSFREAPALLAALRRLVASPDVLMCDGHGVAHPRRLGIASHLGLLTGLPAVGCAKSRLVGEHGELGLERGQQVALWMDGERVGEVLRTRSAVRPVFVSVGHLMDLAQGRELVLRCALRHRLPEPTRQADRLVAAWKRDYAASGREDLQSGRWCM